MKVAEDTYSLPPLPPSTYQPPTSYPMPIATPPISGSNISLSHQNLSSEATNQGQTSMMSVPITPLIPSTPSPVNSQLDQNNQVMMTQVQSGKPSQFMTQGSCNQPFTLTSQAPLSHLAPNSGTVVATSTPQFPLTSMVRQPGRLTPDSRSTMQQHPVQISLTSEVPLTPPPLTILPQSSGNMSSASNDGTILPTTTIMSAMQDEGGMSIIKNSQSLDLSSQSVVTNIPKHGQTISIQQQVQSNILSPNQFPSHNMTPTGTPPPASPSLHAQQLSLNLMDPSTLNLTSPNIQLGMSNVTGAGIEQSIMSKDQKSDEEKKNDLINAKLFKMNSFQGSKSQAPTRQKSIEKGESQKIKNKKLKDKQQATITLLRDSGDESTVIGNMSAIIKQELPGDSTANLHIHNSFGDKIESNNYELSSFTEDKATLVVNNGVKVENFPVTPGDRLEIENNLEYNSSGTKYGISDALDNGSMKISSLASVENAEFVVPSNTAITSRNENISIRKKVSGIYFGTRTTLYNN